LLPEVAEKTKCCVVHTGDRAIETGVLGFVDYTHPSTAEFLRDLIVRDGRLDHDDLLSEGRQHLQRIQHRCLGWKNSTSKLLQFRLKGKWQSSSERF
jgi:hypothetical protein